MKKRVAIYLTFLLCLFSVQFCYAQEDSQVSRVIVDLTDIRPDFIDQDTTTSSFYPTDTKQAYLPKTGEKKNFFAFELGLTLCLFAILLRTTRNRLNKK
ncbi:hypothetical protein BCR24_09505 [Enterococcus ureilyticus]|uniref:Gram-positive cocci surface proteins LPxTG domain-containing protein n=1 Tax=Enterococcus ureilyticus TaxID=1131292 RepID=A0A1E5H5A6_9ENTE|nr:LPXTG cell wall anchor domain-containing protein [Enterococcus ureilyticus]MBM7689056.1 LPXTG-motif cell wall-anchored protein [Enterococcus ureilyticus]OEG20148.1 hypothetical protein BCR24_09505 [Enterococcus ureilyticus]